MTITLDDLRKCHLRESLHGRGAKGMYVYHHDCVEHPRLQRRVRCEGRGLRELITWWVDGVEVAYEDIPVALDRPHDLAGCPVRLQERLFHGTAELVDGRLTVVGARRPVEELIKNFPRFEGVPIDWRDAP